MSTAQAFARPFLSTVAFALLVAAPVAAQSTDALAFRYEAPVAISPVPGVTAEALTDDVLASLWTNPTRAADLTPDPERSTADFARFALATTAAAGAYASHVVLGSAPAEQGHIYTYARVRFEDASVLVRFTWAGTTLVTVTRGAEPALPPALARH